MRRSDQGLYGPPNLLSRESSSSNVANDICWTFPDGRNDIISGRSKSLKNEVDLSYEDSLKEA